eukprot:TRINITY_DN32033_c0_g1_i1.p1 TRINITY_DN32033_c0_g1~~TRINITY_DN32033_c0_g1_i1.p1  ORF type:complete len:225 (+),score=46.13 TRINITY_DN32033_c0_g1_i1:26-676(+)
MTKLRGREHKQRAQPETSRQYGALERRGDLAKRVKDTEEKREQIRTLQGKAAYRNPDEFRFSMINAELDEDGLPVLREKPIPESRERKEQAQTLSYLMQARQHDLNKIDQLKASLAYTPDFKPDNKHIIFVESEQQKESLLRKASFDRPTYDVPNEMKRVTKRREELKMREARVKKLQGLIDHVHERARIKSKEPRRVVVTEEGEEKVEWLCPRKK